MESVKILQSSLCKRRTMRVDEKWEDLGTEEKIEDNWLMDWCS